MKLTNEDKELMRKWGHDERDFPQIEEALKVSKTKYRLGREEISRDEAIRVLGRREYLSGISRSAFHYTAARQTNDGQTVVFDTSRLFREKMR